MGPPKEKGPLFSVKTHKSSMCHDIYIYTYTFYIIYHKHVLSVGKFAMTMDGMGKEINHR